MNQQRTVVLLAPEQGHYLGWQGGMIVYKALSAETNGQYALSVSSVPPWSGPQPLVQTREDRGFFVLDGELTFSAGNKTLTVPSGGFLNVRRGTVHSFVNSSETESTVLAVNAPGGFDRFQFEVGHPLPDSSALVPPTESDDPSRLKEAARKYGIELSPTAEAFQRPPSVRLTGLEEGRSIYVVGDLYRFLAVGEDTGGSYARWEGIVSPDGGPPLHVHSREEEGFYILEGEITFTIEDRAITAGRGTFASLPPGVRHAFRNNSESTARMLILVAPAGLEKMFEETGVPVADPASTAPPVSSDEIERLLAAAPRYGLTIFPPQS